MKNKLLPFLILLFAVNTHAQSKRDLKMQIAALKADTTRLGEENRRLNKKLKEAKWQLAEKTKSADYWKFQTEQTERKITEKLGREIKQLSFMLERALYDPTKKQYKHKVVYFGEKDEFHGHSHGNSNVSAPADYIAIPFAQNRNLTNTLNLGAFSLSHRTNVFYKVEINSGGNVVRLWCNEKRSDIKNRTLLRLIGEEIKRQAQYNKIKSSGNLFESGQLVDLKVRIPYAVLGD